MYYSKNLPSTPRTKDTSVAELSGLALLKHALRLEDDLDRYRTVGFYIFNSFGTMAILLQEIQLAFARISSGDLNVRGSKRLVNVLTLLQAREEQAIKWALRSDIVDVCLYAIQIGSELSKLISMYILESILQNEFGMSALCEPECSLLDAVMEMCGNLVTLLAAEKGFSPRLLFHVIRCYILLTQNARALEMVKIRLPPQLQNETFLDLMEEFPTLARLLHQLLLNVGKTQQVEPQVAFRLKTENHPCQTSEPWNSHPLQPVDPNTP